MNYEYKIVNIDPNTAFIKRVVLYIAILTITVSLALIVLFILFERYLSLVIPGALILASIGTMLLVGSKVAVYEYTFTDRLLTVSVGREKFSFDLEMIVPDKNAEKSDFLNKKIIKMSFINNRIVVKNTLNDNTFSAENFLFYYDDKLYLAAFDNYALAIIKGAKDEI